jgi:hypothetical protein
LLHINVYNDPTPGSDDFVAFLVETGTTCAGSFVGTYQIINPGSIGEIYIPLEPGVGVPAGDAVCGVAIGSAEADVEVSGYTVPSSSVTSGPLHRLPALPKQR